MIGKYLFLAIRAGFLSRYTELLCISAQIFQLDGGSWRELTKDFVLLHVYYDSIMRLTKLIALDGIKLIIKDLALSPCLTLTRPTKKFVHFVSSVYGRSEMYGFGLRKVEDVALFMDQVNRLSKKLSQIVTSNDRGNIDSLPILSKSFSIAAPTSFASNSLNMDHSSDSIWLDSSSMVSPPMLERSASAIERGLKEVSLSDDDFTETAVPSVLGALDDVYRTPTKQYMKGLRES
uniref:WH1 domain-containing protein n=1 Tax=Syphacia muris TaxID=451379 RepID=A0A0N5AUY8_9BILA